MLLPLWLNVDNGGAAAGVSDGGNLYITQGKITLLLDTGIDLSDATNLKILYKTPEGRTGHFNAATDGDSLSYQLSNTDITVTGEWLFQAKVNINGLNAYGDITKLYFNKPIDK